MEKPDETGKCVCSYLLRDNICVSTCEEGEYIYTNSRQGSSCQPCHKTCNVCNGPGENSCLECVNDMEEPDDTDGGKCICSYFLRNGTCVTECEEGEYVDSSAGSVPVCQPCHDSCKTCSGSGEDSCLECANSLEEPDDTEGGACICSYFLRDNI